MVTTQPELTEPLDTAAPVILTPAMRDGILLAAARLDRLAAAHRSTRWGGAYEFAAAALREELKIAGKEPQHAGPAAAPLELEHGRTA